MPEQTPFRCPEFSCRKKLTSDTWQLNHIKLHHPEHLQVLRQQNLAILSMPRGDEPTERCEFNANKDSVEDLDVFLYLEVVKNIGDLASRPLPPSVLCTEANPSGSATLWEYISEPW